MRYHLKRTFETLPYLLYLDRSPMKTPKQDIPRESSFVAEQAGQAIVRRSKTSSKSLIRADEVFFARASAQYLAQQGVDLPGPQVLLVVQVVNRK